ncbi:hypothetical protein R0I01_05300 [Bacillus pumilus]|nr:hypothetical protein R0I01_05300 [Bacillus pumilus]
MKNINTGLIYIQARRAAFTRISPLSGFTNHHVPLLMTFGAVGGHHKLESCSKAQD